MTQAWRLAQGGAIDRTRPLAFTFDGVRYEGYAGDTLASALLANGVHLVGRSFKYHRPRGIFSAGVEEPNALVQLGEGARTEPNTRATTIDLYDGLVATSQNCWPSVRFD
ncbi:MAG TPA: 2Fe-2S iron-sulfur cluster-binding protein, partial [Casimicrobiaceae bacterium]|nr:2Fe-2S iron-sulfur cluster-binding protein [Casimicrobiaceae bacterium]